MRYGKLKFCVDLLFSTHTPKGTEVQENVLRGTGSLEKTKLKTFLLTILFIYLGVHFSITIKQIELTCPIQRATNSEVYCQQRLTRSVRYRQQSFIHHRHGGVLIQVTLISGIEKIWLFYRLLNCFMIEVLKCLHKNVF